MLAVLAHRGEAQRAALRHQECQVYRCLRKEGLLNATSEYLMVSDGLETQHLTAKSTAPLILPILWNEVWTLLQGKYRFPVYL